MNLCRMAFFAVMVRRTELVSGLLNNSVLRILVNRFSFAFPDGNHKNHDFLIDDLVYQPITRTTQFEFVAVRQLAKPIGFNTRIFEYFSQLLFKLLA